MGNLMSNPVYIYIYIYKDKYLETYVKIGDLQYEEILMKSQGPFSSEIHQATTIRSHLKNNINKFK